MNKLPMVLW